ncbi:cyclic nucleotide-binding protein [Glycocaulis profundi]|nr:cyclic nucleotide-binding protein [Glycocaulis profundi]
MSIKYSLMIGVASSALAISPSHAQTDANEARPDPLEIIVVTGRAGSAQRSRVETSYALTALSAEDLRLSAPLSTAEIFKDVPGFWVEASGGEASNNIRTRGIPRDGYSSVSLQEDGLPVQHDGGLGYMNADQSFRLDETIDRVEVVRGGPASVFASNAPGGIVNFITRRVRGDQAEGVARVQVGDYGLLRTDFYYGAPIGGGWELTAGGFYRSDDGIRDPGFRANQGGQFRVGLGRDLANGRLDVNFKRIDDRVAFLLPVPLTFDSSGDVAAVRGFDANFGTLMGPDNQFVSLLSPEGPVDFDLTRGTHTELNQFTVALNLDVGGGWTLDNRFRYRQSQMTRNGLFPTGDITPAADYLASMAPMAAAFPGAAGLEMRFATSGDPFDITGNAGNGLVVGGNLLGVSVPLDEAINDFRMTRGFDFAGQRHDVAFGVYAAQYDFRFDRFMSTSLIEVADQARRVDILAVDAAGDVVGGVTRNGILRHGSLYDKTGGQSRTVALYASDEWQVTPWLRIDGGARYERTEITGSVETKTTVDLGDPTTLADNQVITGTGQFIAIDREYDNTSWTLGATWLVSDAMNVFARYTDTFRTPNGTDFVGNPLREDIGVEPIKMAEAGLNWQAEMFDLYATGFYTRFEGIRFTDFQFDNDLNEFVQRSAIADTVTWGLEIEGVFRPVDWFDVSGAVTWQNPEYDGFVFTEIVDGEPVERNFSGNQLIRVPELGGRIVPGVNLMDGRLRAELAAEYYSDRFADVANSVELPDYVVLNANARLDVTDSLSLQLNATNLTNEIGLTEGNPRAGQFISGDAGAEFYLARPILGRSFRVAATYRF